MWDKPGDARDPGRPGCHRSGGATRVQPATLATYKIRADGKLTFVRALDIETNGMTQWWGGFVRTG